MTTAAAATNTGGADPGAGGGNTNTAANAPWYGEIPAERADLREWVTNKGYKDPVSALDSAFNLEKLIGFDKAGRTLVMPKDDKDVEGLKAFRAKLGVPEAADKYELPMRALKDGEQHSDDEKKFTAAVSSWMHSNNIPKTAAHALSKSFDEYFATEVKAQQAAAATTATKALDTLKGEWGGKFEENAEYARRFLKGTGSDDAWLATYEATFGTADMLQRFFKWGSATGEHPFKGGEGGSHGMTLQQAEAKQAELHTQRMSGAITDAQWRDGKGKEFDQLSEFIHSKKNNA